MLLASFAQLVLSAIHKSATMDEQLHILNGVAWFLSERQRVIVGNPPLVNMLQALPLVILDKVHLPTDSWSGTRWQEISQQFLWQTNGDRALRLVFLARLSVMALTLLLAAGVYRPDTMQRWSIFEDGDAVADHLWLHPVSVEAK